MGGPVEREQRAIIVIVHNVLALRPSAHLIERILITLEVVRIQGEECSVGKSTQGDKAIRGKAFKMIKREEDTDTGRQP
jgi:hypothetical protein